MGKVESLKKAERLSKLTQLLYRHPRGLTTQEMARLCAVTQRTIQRDLRSLQRMDVPLWQEGDRYGVLRDASRHLDKFGVLHDCPICGAEVQVTLYQCENCCKPVRSAQVATCDVFHPPVGLAAANLVLQRQGPVGDQKARWVA